MPVLSITSDLKDFNHFLWALFQISRELSNDFFGEKILESRLDKRESIGEKLRLIGIFRSANHTLTNRIVTLKTWELRSVIAESEEELRNWFEEHIDSSKSNSGFGVALALKGAQIVDEKWLLPFIRANFGEERVIKCLEKAEAKTDKSESLINGILGWLNNARSRTFADLDRAKSYHWEGETYLRLKKFDAAKGSFSEAEELFLNLNNRERAFDAAYRHIYVYILEEEEKEWIDYESYFNFLEGFLERYKDVTTKEYQFHEKQIDYYKNKSKNFYNKGDFDTACKFSKEAYEYAEKIYEKYPTDDFKRVIPLNKAFYWRAKANLLKIGRPPDHHKIAEYYEEAAQNSEKREKYMDLANCYKHKAIASNEESNLEKFFENIAKSIEYETKLGVEEVKSYLENLKKESLLVFPYIDNLAKSIDDFLEIAREPDKIWEFLSLIIQSEKTVYYYREGNKDTSKVSRAAYEYAEELYEKYPSEDIECLISLNKAFYWRATAKLLKDEPEPRDRLIAKSYEKAAQASEKYDEKASYKDCAERYKYKAFAFRDEPEKYLENISKAIDSAVKVGVEQDFKRLKQEYIHSRSAVQNYFKDRDFEKTRKFSREIFEYVEKTYGKNPRDWNIKRIISFNKAIYWRATAEILKEERLQRNNLGIAGYYKEAAQFNEKYDEKESYKDWENHFKYRSLAFKNRPEEFLENISKAIEYAIKAGDEKARNYLEDLKQKRLVAFSRMGDFESRIRNLKIAKGFCHKSGDGKSAKLCKFLISLLYSYDQIENAITEEEIKKALSSFKKLITVVENEDIEFPNLSISKEALEAEKHKLEGEIWWSRGNFSKATDSFKEWLESEVVKKGANERELKSYEILERCSDIISKEDIYSKSEVRKAQRDLNEYLIEPLSKKISVVVNLLISRISSYLGGFRDEEFLEKNKMEIINIFRGKKIIEMLEFDQKLEDATEEISWLYELPEEAFGKTFDEIMHDFDRRINRGEPVRDAINDFEILFLERYVKILIEFNAKILWKEQWKDYVEDYLEKIGGRGKDFFRATFGDYSKILNLVGEEGIKRNDFYCNIKEEILDLLEKHVKIRNDINHGREILFEGVNEPEKLKKEILKIMYSLLPLFPLCLMVERGPYLRSWYRATLLWGKFSPKSVEISFEDENQNLNENEVYYIDRASLTDSREIEPAVLATATFLKEFLGIKNEFAELIPFVKETYGNTLDELSQMVPEDAAGWLKKASSFYKLRKYEETIECLDECLKIEPENALALSNKGDALAKLESHDEEALECFKQALKSDPTNVFALVKKGNSLYKFERYEDAIKCYETALEYAPWSTQAWDNKGDALFKLERYEDAIDCYNISLEYVPENIFVQNKKGQTLNRLKNYDEALECFDTVLNLDPTNVIAWSGKGEALSKLEEYEEALECINQALELKPENIVALDNKGFVLSKLGKDNEAIEWFEKALKLDRKYTSAWINKGFSLSKLEKYEEAIKCYDDAIGIEPDNAAAWKNKGFALEKIGRSEEEALECYEKAIDIEPDNAATWRIKGHLLEKLGRQEEASKSFESASDLFAKKKGVPRKDLRDILQEINENPEDYDLFRQIFDAKFSDEMKSKWSLMGIFDEFVSMSLKRATKDSPFEISTKIFQSCQKLCEELYGDEYKRKFTDLFNSRVIPRFRKIVLGDEYKIGPIESDEELKTLLREFERTFGDLGVKIPLLEEIEDEIKKWLKSKGKPIK